MLWFSHIFFFTLKAGFGLSQAYIRVTLLVLCSSPGVAQLVSSIEADDECLNISQQNWYLDDGIIAGDRKAVACALDLMMELGPHLGLHTNLHKCELFSRNQNSFFPTSVKFSPNRNMIILASPLGDLINCTRFFAD